MRTLVLLIVYLGLLLTTAMAQDPVKVNPENFKVEFENDQVRVLRVQVPPHGKLAMHEHPANVLVAITDSDVRDTFPDGKTAERRFKAGQTAWRPAVKHANENLSDRPVESILVELKGK